jgi:hypothetical protein
MPFYLFKSSRLIAYSTPQAVQPMGSTSYYGLPHPFAEAA